MSSPRTNPYQSHLIAFVLPTTIVLLASLFYIYEFVLRVIPSVITHELMRDFQANAASLGFMSASFYYAYAFMQIPAGMLCDRFGPRIVLTFAAIICGLATLTFAHTHSLLLAGIARFAIGVASSCGFIAPVLLASRWFSSQYYAMITGLIQTLGSLGAIMGGQPIAIMIHHHGWRITMIFVAYCAFILALCFAIGIRNHPKQNKNEKTKKSASISIRDALKSIVNKTQTWCVALIAMCCWAPIAIFELWGIPFLCRWHHCAAATSAKAMLWLWIGIAVWSPIVGRWSNLSQSRKKPLQWTALIGLITSILIVYNPTQSWPFMESLLFIMGISAAAQPVTFGVVKDLNPPHIAGIAVGFNNMATIAGGPIFQPLTGIILSALWHHQILDGAPVYSVHAYHVALCILPITCFIGLLTATYLLKETHCRPTYT
jgi:MFS family permease